MKDNNTYEISATEALKSRELLEEYITSKVLHSFQPAVSAILTWATGIAPTRYSGQPVFQPSLTRETVYLVTGFMVAAFLFALPGFFPLLGAVALLGACRNLVSGTGHVLNHKSKSKAMRLAYDVASALVAVGSWDQYKASHRFHHEDTASKTDPDRELLEYLGVRPASICEFLRCAMSPRLHFRFCVVRLRALFVDGPKWRPVIFCLFGSILFMVSVTTASLFYGVVLVAYQIIAIAAWLSLHRWWAEKPEGPTAKELAVAVTLGRLNLPSASPAGVISLIGNVLVCSVLHPGAGERNHDLHHGSWRYTLGSYCPYTRTALIMAGVELRQTGSLRAMYVGAFASAKTSQRIKTSKNIDDNVFLSL